MKLQQSVLLLLALLSPLSVNAQNFEYTNSAKPSSLSAISNNDEAGVSSTSDIQKALASTSNQSNKTATADTDKKSDNDKSQETDKSSDFDDEDFFVPENEIGRYLDTPTVDGSERGGQAFVMVNDKGEMKKIDYIFLFYDNFKISHGFANYTTCDVRFNIISNLDRKLSQFDVKLVWPDMTTTLSFSDIAPYTQTYYNYTLLGQGCYSMDKAPNIIVNRCRAKGMTSMECAEKIKWVSK